MITGERVPARVKRRDRKTRARRPRERQGQGRAGRGITKSSAERASSSCRARDRRALRSPMVGRDAELCPARRNAGRPFRAGLGRMALVVGEPGIGRAGFSRSCAAVAAADGFGWVEARTVSYGRNLPAAPGDRPGPRAHRPARSTSRDPRWPRPASGWRAGFHDLVWVPDDAEEWGRSSAISCRCRSTGWAPSVWRTWSPGGCSFDTAKRCFEPHRPAPARTARSSSSATT